MVKRKVQRWEHEHQRRWPDAREGPWDLTLRFGVVRGRVECVGLTLLPAEDCEPTALTPPVIRQVALSRLVAESHQERLNALSAHVDSVEAARDSEQLDEPHADVMLDDARSEQEMFQGGARKSKGGRPRELHDEHYRKVAAIYLAAHVAGERNVTQRVATELKTSKSSAARWVARARQLGLLPPTTKGKAGGSPTTQDSQ